MVNLRVMAFENYYLVNPIYLSYINPEYLHMSVRLLVFNKVQVKFSSIWQFSSHPSYNMLIEFSQGYTVL